MFLAPFHSVRENPTLALALEPDLQAWDWLDQPGYV
jgi:hypothetical protein